MNIIEIDILSLLENTRYFIPQITVILSQFWIIALCSQCVYMVALIHKLYDIMGHKWIWTFFLVLNFSLGVYIKYNSIC